MFCPAKRYASSGKFSPKGMETTNDGFKFRRISSNTQIKGMRLKAAVSKESGLNKAVPPPFLLPLQKKPKNVESFEIRLRRNNTEKQQEPRKTLRLDDSIDLSTKSESFISEEDKTLIMSYPVVKDNIKSTEIHTLLKTPNINVLIKECIKFLKPTCNYSKEIMAHCDANYFSDINYIKEIESVKSKASSLKAESSKWKNIFEKKKKEIRIVVPEIEDSEEWIISEEDIWHEFEEKGNKLREAEVKVKGILCEVKEKSDFFMKSIFSAAKAKSVDPIFLLRAMSKLGTEEQRYSNF